MMNGVSPRLALLMRMALMLIAALALAGPWSVAVSVAGPVMVRSGQSIAFLGDSITANGWNERGGYVHLVVLGLAAQGIVVKPIPAGISGNTSKDMLARLQRDVLSKRPDWMTLSCGVNDVWHGPVNGVLLPQYERNITAIVDRAQAAGIHVIILTATLIGENPNNPANRKLARYNAFLRKLADQKNCLLADVGADEIARLTLLAHAPRLNKQLLTMDGVHPNPWGNVMFAKVILRTLGLNHAQLALAQKKWNVIPRAYWFHWSTMLSLKQYNSLRASAARQHCSMDVLLNKALGHALARLLSNTPAR